MKFKVSICAILLASLIAASAQVSSHSQPSSGSPAVQVKAPSGKPVARVNGVALTDKDLLREELLIFPYAKQHGGAIPADMEPGIRKGALQMIIFEELVYQDAQRRGISIAPEKLRQSQAEFRRQFDSAAEYKQFLQAEFQGNEQLLREKIKRSLLIEKVLSVEVEKKAVVTLADIKLYYQKNPARFAYPESFAIQTISVIPPEKATATQLKEAKKRAEEAYRQAKATKNAEEFGLLAEKISEDDYRVMMGDHKWVSRDKMPPEMLGPALKMQNGQMSQLIQVGQNYVIFRMNRHIPAGKTPFAEVKDKLRVDMEKQKTNAIRAAFNKKLQQSAKVETL
jgi:parvulin-like peptidyl-prolyl isomerase